MTATSICNTAQSVGAGGAARDDTWLCNPNVEKGCLFRCRWLACSTPASSTLQLQQHVLDAHCAEEFEREHDWRCGVVGCDAVLNDEHHRRRHMLFHCFHADRQQRGRETLAARATTKLIVDCGHTASSGLVFDGSPLVCAWNTCMCSFDDMLDYVQHVDDHVTSLDERDSVDKNFACQWPNCAQSFANKNNLRWHVRHHSGDKPVACPFCGRFFANNTKLADHVIRKIENGRLKCFLCQKTFLTERLLREHGRRHVKNYKCPFCDMTVETPSDLRDHITKRHSLTRSHQCTKCPKAFFQKSDLDRHVLIHEDRYPYECTFCPQAFKWKRQLNVHIRQHDMNADPYTHLCHLCPTKFKNGSNLSKHLTRKHEIRVPSGHSRFQYKKCADGYLRLQTERYESEKLAAQIEAIQRGEKSALIANSDNHTSTLITSE